MKHVGFATAIAFAALLVGCDKKPEPVATETTGSTAATTAEPAPVKPADGLKELKTEDVKVGKGPPAEVGDILLVAYTGKLKDGTVFDSNDKPDGTPFAVRIGEGSVIQGWEKGLVGMKEGGTRKLSIPSELGYGERGQVSMSDAAGGIPPHADLFFEIKALAMVKTGEEGVYDKTDVKLGSGRAAMKGDKVHVHYVGTFVNGKKFDSSRDANAPFEFTVGAGGVIQGWDAGVIGMKPGGIRKLRLPPALAYGQSGSPPSIGPHQVLDFEIELLKILPKN